MQTTQPPEAPAPGVRLAARVRGEPASIAHRRMLQQMSLEELLYYVLKGDGRQLGAELR
jgi:hypothetical protein